MTLAIRGDRTSCLSLQLGSGTWLLAVARGFGQMGGLPIESALLARLRSECQGRMRSPLFRRAIARPQAAATAMLAVLARVNGSLYANTANHDDYVTAAASLTAVIVVQGLAYVIHAGATAAYLARGGAIAPLCNDDVMEERPIPVLARAFAAAPVLDVGISNVSLIPGDAIVLLGRRIAGASERQMLLERLEASDLGERILVARFEDDDGAIFPASSLSVFRVPGIARIATGIAAAVGFLAAAVLAH
ncbi:MAG: hypothetical protein ABSF08_02095 [Candidatus Cybelea sp.]|jgi:hypothetical protein